MKSVILALNCNFFFNTWALIFTDKLIDNFQWLARVFIWNT